LKKNSKPYLEVLSKNYKKKEPTPEVLQNNRELPDAGRNLKNCPCNQWGFGSPSENF
jgi:hypothetical protein